MQFSIATLATVFAAAVSALPSDVTPRQSTFTELSIWSTSGCPAGTRTGTAFLVNSGVCESLPAGITAAKVEIDIPAGCSVTFFVGGGCSSAQTIKVPQNQVPHNCFEPGQGKVLGSYIATGC